MPATSSGFAVPTTTVPGFADLFLGKRTVKLPIPCRNGAAVAHLREQDDERTAEVRRREDLHDSAQTIEGAHHGEDLLWHARLLRCDGVSVPQHRDDVGETCRDVWGCTRRERRTQKHQESGFRVQKAAAYCLSGTKSVQGQAYRGDGGKHRATEAGRDHCDVNLAKN